MPVKTNEADVETLAYTLKRAAELLSINYRSIRREVRLGKIKRTPMGVIPRTELIRYLEHEIRPTRGRPRKHKG